MVEQQNKELDPADFEVLYHRMLSITEEMGIQYMRCSGSNVLITGNDAATTIMMDDGALVSMGPYIVTQGNVLPLIVDSTLRAFADAGAIREGDAFICNDPYLGAIHQPDFATVAPVHHEGELVAWMGVSGHQLDTGGMDPGGFSVGAVDVYQEGLRMPPLRIIEGHQVREDILAMILNQVRDPIVALDVRGQFAALNAGRRRFVALIEEWGVDAVKAVMKRSISHAREKLRARLQELPDGRWREVQYIDHDGHDPLIFEIVCTLTKRDDELMFDFAGTSPQARGLINCTYSGLQAAVLSAVYINLCWDIPWNRGILDCVRISSPGGTVNDCEYPAPCAMATISGVIVTIDAAWRCLSHMLLASEKYREETMAVWSGTSMAPIISGTSQHGFPFAATEMSHFGGGSGARTYADGVDTGGIVFNTTPNMPNIEDQESEYPLLYLFRRHLTDSGGPGQFRGGMSGELAYTVYGSPKDDVEGLFAGTGAEMPNAIGLAGGLPGAAIRAVQFTDSDILAGMAAGETAANGLDAIPGQREFLPSKHRRTPIIQGDVWYHNWQGGGGYGDPLLRNPAAVAADVARGGVSEQSALNIYGVIPDDDQATERQRSVLRKARLAQAVKPDPGDARISFAGNGKLRYGDVLQVDFDADEVLCCHCGCRHCGPSENLLEHLGEVLAPLTAAGPVRGEDYDSGRFHIRMLCCLGCGVLIDVQVAKLKAPRGYMQFGPNLE
jgi:N-methylhydantoinase B